MKIINGINPLASGIDWLAIPDLAEFWKEHPPANADQGGQRCVWMSPADNSVASPHHVKCLREVIKKHEKDPWGARAHADKLLASFCPVKTVKHLVEVVKLPRDFGGVIGFDHEIPAWMSCLHGRVYYTLMEAIRGVFPHAQVREYAGVPCDWVRDYSKPDRSHEIEAMRSLASSFGNPIYPMPSAYVPGWEYIKDLEEFKRRLDKNVDYWKRSGYSGMVDTIAISPIIKGTYKNGDYTSGDVVPVEVMRIILQAIHDAGAAAVLWGAAADSNQAERLLEAVQESVVKAAGGVK